MPERGAETRRRWVTAGVCAIVAVAIRGGYLLAASDEPAFLSPGMDAQLYREWAEAILAGNPPAGPYFRAPLYPYLIAALGAVFGDSFWPIRIVQVLVSSAGAGVLAVLARRWAGARAGWAAGLAWALFGSSIYFDGEGLIASLFTSGVIGLLFLLDNARGTRWTLHAVLAAVVFAVMSALRANALAFAPVVIGALAIAGARSGVRPGKRLAVLAACALLVAGALAPIVAHNARTGGGFTISGQGGINLFLGNRDGASGAYAVDPEFGRDWTRAQIEARAERETGRVLSMAEVSRYYTDRALRFWADRPGEALLLAGRKFVALLNGRELGNNRPLRPYLHAVHPLFALLLAVGFPLLMIAALAFAAHAWREIPRSRPALLIALVHALVVIAFFVNARYRLPLAPVLALVFAIGLDRTWRVMRGGSKRADARAERAWLLARVLLAAAVVFLPRPVAPVDEERAWALHRANALLRLDRFDDARVAFHELLREHPNVKHGRLNLGVIHLREGRLDSARAWFEAELAARPDNALAANNLGVAHERAGRIDEALAAYRRALKVDPSYQDARVNLANLLDRLAQQAAGEGRFDRAIELSGEAANVNPIEPRYVYNQAVLLALRGRVERARAVLDSVLAGFPRYAPAREASARLDSFVQADTVR
ncbi:MAG: hypothetical protein MAG453_01198 [Calditrichaeota bacterium]|nr:hypothetical protein [Calditrichota bacterium]